MLAIDTATSTVQVAVDPDPARSGGPTAERAPRAVEARGVPAGERAVSIQTERRHAEVLVPTVRDLLREAGVEVRALAAVIAGVGPGLFTGLRVGVTTARTIARALGVPAVGVSSLEATAMPVEGGRVAAVLDAGRGEVYWATFEDGHRCTPDRVDPPERVAAHLSPGVTIVGEGAHRYATELVRPGVTLSQGTSPDPRAVLRLGVRSLVRGDGVDPSRLLPNYLRRTDAEIARDRRSA